MLMSYAQYIAIFGLLNEAPDTVDTAFGVVLGAAFLLYIVVVVFLIFREW